MTFTSDTAGKVTGRAAADVDSEAPSHVETDGKGLNCGDAIKRFVDARIWIGPDDTNGVAANHMFKVMVLQDDGLAAGEGGDGAVASGPPRTAPRPPSR